jgi:hypothetical protein
VSGEHDRRLGRDLVAELVGELEALLARAAGDTSSGAAATVEHETRPLLQAGAATPPATSWQEYANELRDLCRRVLEEADEETARAFWSFLIETAARHGRRAGGLSP